MALFGQQFGRSHPSPRLPREGFPKMKYLMNTYKPARHSVGPRPLPNLISTNPLAAPPRNTAEWNISTTLTSLARTYPPSSYDENISDKRGFTKGRERLAYLQT